MKKTIEKTEKPRRKGTAWYFSDIAIAVTSLFGILFLLLMAAMIMFVLSSRLEIGVIGTMMYSTPKADNLLLTFLDSTSDGHSMKELLSYGMLKGGTDFSLDGKKIDLKATSAEMMNKITTTAYALKLDVGGKDVTLASSGKAEAIDNIKTEMMIQGGGRSGKLTLTIAK